MARIELTHVTKRWGGFYAVDDLDLLIEDIMILELKSVAELLPLHYKQLRSYLRLLNKPMGWLINFNEDDFAHGMVKVPNRYYRPD